MKIKPPKKPSIKITLVFYVLAAVGLNILSAITLKTLADQPVLGLFVLMAGIGAVLSVNTLRMAVWHSANKRFPLSSVYPLTCLFYPAMLVVSFFYGESVSFLQLSGTILITLGTFWLGWRVNVDAWAIP